VLKDIVAAGFTIESVMSFHLSTSMAETLFSVYRNIYSQYIPSLEHMSSGPSLAVYISGKSDNVVKDFRAFCGPLEPELAALVRPGSLRAKYGRDRVQNGVHCTDLLEDGGMECTFFFETLAAL
jgi:nucleoside-diphosphate kinase